MQSYYAVYGSPLHLLLDDEFASNYNNAQKAFFQAQKDYLTQTGKKWTGIEKINVNLTPEELKAFNEFAELMNLMIKLNGGSMELKEEDMKSDYLEKI